MEKGEDLRPKGRRSGAGHRSVSPRSSGGPCLLVLGQALISVAEFLLGEWTFGGLKVKAQSRNSAEVKVADQAPAPRVFLQDKFGGGYSSFNWRPRMRAWRRSVRTSGTSGVTGGDPKGEPA